MAGPAAVLLLPRKQAGFILRDQADDLLRSPGVRALEPPRVPYGAVGRLPDAIARAVARRQVHGLDLPADLRALAIFHPFQLPLAEEVLRARPGCELWYGRWDRYERAPDAGPRTRRRLDALHERAARRSALTFVASDELARLERDAGREPTRVPLAADSFPAPDPASAVVAVSLGHLGRRVDWRLLREVASAMPELVVLLVGERHEDELRGDADFSACLRLPNLVWLGPRSDDEAARLILCADVGIVPFAIDDFNDAGLPYRILKYARLGRRTVVPPLRGAATWERAVVRAHGVHEWAAALRTCAGSRVAPDLELREWALAQTAESQNAPLWERLRELGVADPES